MTDRKRLEAIVHGRVQGVGFRWFVRSTAARLKLDGWVANEPSGSVRVVVEGDEAQLAQMVAALSKGPPGAFVDAVDTRTNPPTGELSGFEIRAGSHSGD